MNCVNHADRPAVATCSQGCGRGLCQECASYYDPPICPYCLAQIQNENRAAVAQSRTGIIFKLVINVAILVCYILLIRASNAHAETGATDYGWLWLWVPLLIWGFLGFRWLLDVFTDVTGIMLFAGLRTWGCAFLIGSFICALLAIVVIPVMIILQAIQLARLSRAG